MTAAIRRQRKVPAVWAGVTGEEIDDGHQTTEAERRAQNFPAERNKAEAADHLGESGNLQVPEEVAGLKNTIAASMGSWDRWEMPALVARFIRTTCGEKVRIPGMREIEPREVLRYLVRIFRAVPMLLPRERLNVDLTPIEHGIQPSA